MTDDEHLHSLPDNAYGSLVEADSDARWAFGAGFDDPLAGLDVTVPDGVDAHRLAAYCLALGDDALVLAQRLNEWCTHAPELEEEVALANIALDLLGQTRLLYARAAAADPAVVPDLGADSPVPDEDRLAFFRGAEEFRPVTLVQLPNGDFAVTVARLVVFAAWRLAVLEDLERSDDPVMAAVGGKAVKEVAYHRDYAARWFLVLAGGTEESRRRLVRGLDEVWPHVAGLATEPTAWGRAQAWLARLLAEAALAQPRSAPTGLDGRAARHTPWLAPLLEEMQSIARAHPRGRW